MDSQEYPQLFQHNLFSGETTLTIHLDDETETAFETRVNPEVIANIEPKLFDHQNIPEYCSTPLKFERIANRFYEGAVVYQEGNVVNGIGVIVEIEKLVAEDAFDEGLYTDIIYGTQINVDTYYDIAIYFPTSKMSILQRETQGVGGKSLLYSHRSDKIQSNIQSTELRAIPDTILRECIPKQYTVEAVADFI